MDGWTDVADDDPQEVLSLTLQPPPFSSSSPPPSSCDLSSCLPLRLLRSNRTRQETRGSHGGEPSAFLERGRENDVCWRCCCRSPLFFSLLDFSLSVRLPRPFPCSRPRSCLPLSLSLSLFWVSGTPPPPLSLLFLPSSPSVSSPQLFSSLLWHNIRSEPFVLSPPLLFPLSPPPPTPTPLSLAVCWLKANPEWRWLVCVRCWEGRSDLDSVG